MNMKDHMKLDVMLMFKGPEMILISNKLIRLSYLLTELRIALVIKTIYIKIGSKIGKYKL